MKFLFQQTRQASLRRHVGAIGLVGALVLAGWVVKPLPRLNAVVPVVIGNSERAQRKATAEARIEQRQEQTRQIRPENYDLSQFPVTDANEKHWRNILWTTAVIEPQEAYVAAALEQILSLMSRSGLSDSQMRTIDLATKTGTQLYRNNPRLYAGVGQAFLRAVDASPDPEWTAVSFAALLQAGMSQEGLQTLVDRMKQRFPDWSKKAHLYTAIQEFEDRRAPNPSPPLADLLNWEVAPRQLHLYVLCQSDRGVLCRTVLKDRDGNFIRHTDGKLWSVPLLLQSLHHLNWNFVRGQTPQGLYRIEGTVPQPDDEYFRAYGQFALVNLFIPFESGVKQFVAGKPGAFKGSLRDYQKLLPPSWRENWGIQQSFWAGKIGRNEFRIHGTGEAPDFFTRLGRNPDTYSWNPTIGCLSALELYNEKGQLIQADMPKILDVLEMVGGKKFAGYLIVANLPGKPGEPIPLTQIEAALQQKRASAKTKPARQAQLPKPARADKPIAIAQRADHTAPPPSLTTGVGY